MSGHEGQRCVSIGFMRPGDSRVDPIIRLTVLDDDMKMTELLDMTPKQFTDLMSGMATWVPDGFAGHRQTEGAGERVLALWNKCDGWIPGGAFAELAEALGVPVSETLHARSNRHLALDPVVAAPKPDLRA